jgi:hypothetical protein
MPNELKLCSGISTSNIVHPEDHSTPLRTGPSPPDLEGNERVAGSHVPLKRQEPTPRGGSSLNRNHSVLSARTSTGLRSRLTACWFHAATAG